MTSGPSGWWNLPQASSRRPRGKRRSAEADTDDGGQGRTQILRVKRAERNAVRIIRIGVISDTHGLLRPEALAGLRRSDYIIHAGDIGDPEILEKLAEIAPVTAVRGNLDRGAWAWKIPPTNVLQ